MPRADAAQCSAMARPQLVAAIAAIDAAWSTSALPPEPPPAAVTALDAWLRDIRKRLW